MTRLMFQFLGRYRLPIIIILGLLLAQALTNLYLPELNADIINNGVAKGDTDYIVRIGALMLGVTAVLGVCSLVAVYLAAKVAMGFGRDVRLAVFRRVETFSQVEMNKFGTPSLITRNTNDVQQVQMVVFMGLTVILLAPIMGIGGVIMALRQDVPLSGLLLVILPIMFGFIFFITSRAVPLFRAMQTKVDRINQVMREALAGVRVIRAFVRVDHEEKRFDEASTDLFNTALRVNRLFAITFPVMMLIFNLSSVAVMWFGAQRIDSGAMPIGNLTAFLAYLMQILFSVLMAVFMIIFVPRAAVSAGRIRDVLETQPSITDPENPVVPGTLPLNAHDASATTNGHQTDGNDYQTDGNGLQPGSANGHEPAARPGVTVEFRHVEFGYPGAEQPVLHDISFSAEPGHVTAIIGSTGSGKSTLINLIPRFYDALSGGVLLDGVDVRDMLREDVWRQIGVVPQQAFLFSGTVASNLRFGDADATDEELERALDIAQASEFVAEMPGGLEAPIDQGGTNVSGGQRQRLAIARALVKRAPLYIFDDSFSALDFRTDSRLRAALRRELASSTVLIVAQRVGTILNADRIVVMDEGRVVGVGTHAELLESSETYREIVYSQLTEAEAKAA
ncbi:MAG TPA: ABC transporter ATP-binding protein [Candidatus Limnocylindrales bacterium]